jgi:universal stress protein A
MKLKTAPRSRLVAKAAWRDISILPFAPAEIKLKKLLVPIDFSESSRKALQYAVSFATCFKAEILLLHAVEMLPPGLPTSFAAESIAETGALQEQGAKHIALWRQAIEKHVPAKARIEIGSPSEMILRAASESKADLIIIGTHGHSGLERWFMGGTARKVVRHAPCPVLVVREQEHDFLSVPKKKSANARKSSRKRA